VARSVLSCRSVSETTATTRGAVCAFALSLLAACGGEGPDNWPGGRPRVDWLRYLQQEPTEPTELQFALAFVDDDADLSGGRVDLFVQDRQTSSLGAQDLFAAQSPPLPDTATSGVLEFVVALDPSVPPGATVRVGVELVDAAGERSNRPSVDLRVIGEEDGR